MKQNKSEFRSRIANVHLNDVMQLAFQMWNQMLILLRSKGRPKFHINNISLGDFHSNVEFCVGYGRDT
jgi:hypothetical protein